MFIPGKPFQTGLVFAGKAGDYQSEVPFRCSTLGLVLRPEYYTLDEVRKVAKEKPSSLLRKFVNYGSKKFCNIDT